MPTSIKVALRAYRSDDFERLHAIDQACYEPDIAYSRSELRTYLGFLSSECVVAEIEPSPGVPRREASTANRGEQRIIGFCVSAHRGPEGYIITIDVMPEYRRLAIGSALLAEIEKRLASVGVRRVSLETAVDNQAGVAFWSSHGYRARGVKKGYYPHGRDAYSMSKTIAKAQAHLV
ncbi:MAG TPA: N-acetyltransferase [Candidatus Cybelea sp.]|nr:N-acetyltransferase [Candidatus Cybelea sp.]